MTFVPAKVWRTGMVVLVLHALWDFGTLGQTTAGRSQKPLAGVLVLATFALGLVATGFIVAAS